MNLKLAIVCVFLLFCEATANSKAKYQTIENLQNEKDFKKLLKSRNNVLVLFTSGSKENQNVVKVFREASDATKGVVNYKHVISSDDPLLKLFFYREQWSSLIARVMT